MKFWSFLHPPRRNRDVCHPLPEPDLAPESMPWPFVRGPFLRGPDRLFWQGETGQPHHAQK